MLSNLSKDLKCIEVYSVHPSHSLLESVSNEMEKCKGTRKVMEIEK